MLKPGKVLAAGGFNCSVELGVLHDLREGCQHGICLLELTAWLILILRGSLGGDKGAEQVSGEKWVKMDELVTSLSVGARS